MAVAAEDSALPTESEEKQRQERQKKELKGDRHEQTKQHVRHHNRSTRRTNEHYSRGGENDRRSRDHRYHGSSRNWDEEGAQERDNRRGVNQRHRTRQPSRKSNDTESKPVGSPPTTDADTTSAAIADLCQQQNRKKTPRHRTTDQVSFEPTGSIDREKVNGGSSDRATELADKEDRKRNSRPSSSKPSARDILSDKEDRKKSSRSKPPTRDTQEGSRRVRVRIIEQTSGPNPRKEETGRVRHTKGEKGRQQKGAEQVNATLQSDQLSQQLLTAAYECMVCCECVRERQEVWSCRSCFHIFHLRCVHRWAKSPAAAVDEGILLHY